MKKRSIGVTALCIAAVLATTTADGSAGATGGAYRPAAGIADAEYSVPYYGRVWNNLSWGQPHGPEAATTARAQYLGAVTAAERDGTDLGLSFAVEGQSESAGYVTCDRRGDCHDIAVRATPEGLLYLHAARNTTDTRYWLMHLADFPRRAVELSATDADSGLKVYREVTVEPPPEAADCEDYGDNTPETFTCLFLRELLPAGQAADADEKYMRRRLPRLVQDSSNYRLVFAEEFNGTPPAADANGCRDGLSTLDPAVWNYADACENLDSRNVACGNVAGGAYIMGAAGPCSSRIIGPFGFTGLNTYGNLHMKYGYIEMKYTFNADVWPYKYYNFTTVLYTHGQKLRYLRDRYGVEVHDWEDLLKQTEVEIDVFEHDNRKESSSQNANWDHHDEGLTPVRTSKWANYCGHFFQIGHVDIRKRCKPDDTFTVTRGLEWTPRGYRTYIKVRHHHNYLTIVPKDMIHIELKPDGTRSRYAGSWERDKYFEYLVPGDAGSLLEQAAVGHVPLPIALSSWGYLDSANPYIRSRIKFDYIRVWQPENHYADMEPVYQ